jgi:hypothetical protein
VIVLVFATNEAFAKLEIKCEFAPNTWPTFFKVYECKVTSEFSVTSPHQIISSISGSHETQKTNDDVTAFYVNNLPCEFFPIGLENFFTNIEVIVLSNTGMKSLTNADLQPFPKLKFFVATGHEIKSIQSDLFFGNKNLQVLGFNDGMLEYVGRNLLTHLKNLYSVDFNKNVCIDSFVEPEDRYDASIRDIRRLLLKNCQNFKLINE